MSALLLAGAAAALGLGYGVLPTYGYKLCNALRPQGRARADTLYLTFDDGPDWKHTPELLDLLAQYGVRASFLVVAEFAARNPELIDRMRRAGHAVGLHSLSHRSALLQTPAQTRADLRSAAAILRRQGVRLRCFRPPWGQFNLALMYEAKKQGLTPVLWDVMAEDWRADTTAEEIAEKLMHRAGGGQVICLHDGRGEDGAPARTIEALRTVLPRWLACGYRFATLEQLYG